MCGSGESYQGIGLHSSLLQLEGLGANVKVSSLGPQLYLEWEALLGVLKALQFTKYAHGYVSFLLTESVRWAEQALSPFKDGVQRPRDTYLFVPGVLASSDT